jgi:hypothetical protein
MKAIFDLIFLRKVIRSKTGEIHFRRWGITTPLFGVYVHNITQSDKDRDPHDHPWWFMSLILAGGYVERRVSFKDRRKQGQMRVRRPGHFFSCKTTEFHKITLLKPTWTFVITGPRTHDVWGYLTSNGWVDFVTYRAQKNSLERSLEHKSETSHI